MCDSNLSLVSAPFKGTIYNCSKTFGIFEEQGYAGICGSRVILVCQNAVCICENLAGRFWPKHWILKELLLESYHTIGEAVEQWLVRKYFGEAVLTRNVPL
jgi:hypothetical protein